MNTLLKDGSILAEEAEFEKAYTQGWLAGDTNYQNVVEAMSFSDPRLRSRDPKAVTERIPWADNGRTALLEMDDSGQFGPATEYTDVDSLRDFIVQSSGTNTDTDNRCKPKRRLFVVENMGPGYIAALGEHLGIHPSTFVDQERVIVMNTAAQGESNGMLLPSVSCPSSASPSHADQRHITLKYFEVLQFNHRPDNFRLVCGDTGRHIGVSRIDGQFTDVGVIRRKCTTWWRRTANGGWDYVVLCDPAVRCVRTGDGYRDVFVVRPEAYQGGYVDFVPEWAQAGRTGPPRTSLLDDLIFYLQQHAASLVVDGAYASAPAVAMANPDLVVGTFVRKIVGSHYLKLASNIRAILSSAQRALSRKHDLASLPMEKVEELWSDTQASERRVGEYGEDLEAIMLVLGIPLEKPSPGRAAATSAPLGLSYSPSVLSLNSHFLSPQALRPVDRVDTGYTLVSDLDGEEHRKPTERLMHDADETDREADLRQWIDSTVDYQFLLLRFREMRHRTECLNSAVTGLASITGNRQAYHEQQLALETARRSIREAKSSKAVTLLGLIFIPLAYTSSLFSMTEPYNPGGQQFWLYFATSAPLIFLVLAAYTALDAGYTDDGTSWSLSVFLKTSRSWFSRQPDHRHGH